MNARAVLAAYSSLLDSPSASSAAAAALPAGLLPKAAFVAFLRDGLGLASPSVLSSEDLDLLVWEFAAPAAATIGTAMGLSAAGASAGASGLVVDAASVVDGLALYHRDPEALVLQRYTHLQTVAVQMPPL